VEDLPTPQSERDLLDRGLRELDLQLLESQRAALLELAGQVESWGARLNLSGHRDRQTILHRLILDAVALSTVLPASETIADLGSGAGFPGLPLAILRPESWITLIDARQRRHFFQRAVIRALRLENVESLWGRVEVLQPTPHALVVAQALANPTRALELMLPWAAPNALLAIPSAQAPPRPTLPAGLVAEKSLIYSVPCGGAARSVWIARRSASG